MRRCAWIVAFFLLQSPVLAATKDEQRPPDKEMLGLIDMLHDMDMIKNLDLMRQMDAVNRTEPPPANQNSQRDRTVRPKDTY